MFEEAKYGRAHLEGIADNALETNFMRQFRSDLRDAGFRLRKRRRSDNIAYCFTTVSQQYASHAAIQQ